MVSIQRRSVTTGSTATAKRVRQHVNPLASIYQEPLVLPNWSEQFSNPTLPIHLDIGYVWL